MEKSFWITAPLPVQLKHLMSPKAEAYEPFGYLTLGFSTKLNLRRCFFMLITYANEIIRELEHHFGIQSGIKIHKSFDSRGRQC
jgi:hypothetical protein